MSMGDQAELEGELIRRNREIAKVRDDVLKMERRLEESQMRNDDLLEKVSELDGEVTNKVRNATELQEKVKKLEETVANFDKDQEVGLKEHARQLDELQQKHTEKEGDWHKERDGHDGLKTELSVHEKEKADLSRELADEKRKHQTTKASLDQSEASVRDSANKTVELRRRIKELEEQVEEEKANTAQAHSNELEKERCDMAEQLHRVTAQLEEHRTAHQDLKVQSSEHDTKYSSVSNELEELRTSTADHSSIVAALEAARDEITSKHKDHLAKHDEIIVGITKRNEEHLAKATQHASSLDGRLGGQRMMLQETTQALMKCEMDEENLMEKLKGKENDLMSEQEAMKRAVERAREEASADTGDIRAKFKSELETAEVCARRDARSEMDEHSRLATDAEERCRRLEQEIETMKQEKEEVKNHHDRMHESLKGQHSDLRGRHNDAEEKINSHEREADKLKKDLEEARLQAERSAMAHRLEVERLQQTLEVEAQSRNSADQIAMSRLEEKDTLLEHRKANVERLEQELEDHKKKMEGQDENLKRHQTDHDAKAHMLTMRSSTLEGELRVRQERLTEAEGRLEAQRAYLEQVQETLNHAQSDRDNLIHLKGSLEGQLQLEQTHKSAVHDSLAQHQDEADRRCKELEERLLRDRDNHREEIEEVKVSVSEDLRQSADRLTAVEAELVTARQRCELLMRNKADLQQDLSEHKSTHAELEAKARNHASEKESLGLELGQTKSAKSTLEDDKSTLQQEKRECEAKIEKLQEEVRAMTEKNSIDSQTFSAKVARLDELLETERGNRTRVEAQHGKTREDLEERHRTLDADRRRKEQDLQSHGDSWRTKAEEHHAEWDRALERIEAQKREAEDADVSRREGEAKLRSEIATIEARLRLREVEVQDARTEKEDAKAKLAQQKAAMTAKIVSLQRELEDEATQAKAAAAARDADTTAQDKERDSKREYQERLGMASEELSTRQVHFTLERQRLNGALEESRRTLRNSLGAPNPGAAVDSVRLQGLEKQLSEERRKAIEQAVALQRAERKVTQLEDSQKRVEDQRTDSVSRARESENKLMKITEDLRKSGAKQLLTDQQVQEAREQAAMAVAEIATIRYESKYEVVRLRGALDELRYMIKMQRPT